MMKERRSKQGYTLVELLLVIVIIGILAGVGLRSLTAVNQTGRIEETRQEMDRLAQGIAGNPSLTSGGTRTDFGYIGDIGSLPANLDALASNPGGWSTWRGPYITNEFYSGAGSTDFKYDAWGRAYTYSAGITIGSTGGGMTLTRPLAGSAADLLYNRVRLVVTDIDHTPPGTTYDDSLSFVLTVPNGSGGVATRTRRPNPDGTATFDSIPIGIHTLRLIYQPTLDTLTRKVVVEPGSNSYLDISMPDNLWWGS
jgi:general secretion pathway protein G